MKFKVLLSVFIFSLILALLCSCKVSNKNNNQSGNNNENSDTENIILGQDTVPTVVCNSQSLLTKEISTIQEAVFYCIYRTPSVTTDETAPADHEIILGKSNRAVSKRAYTLLERIEKEDEYDASYLIYSDGSSIAIAYDEDVYHTNMAATLATEFFYNWCDGKEYIAVPKSIISSYTFDVLERQEQIDNEENETQWQIFVAEANKLGGDGEEIAKAVKEYYEAVCSDDIISWYANLYEPALGGYYFSNGSRNTPGFLPDAESTVQAVQEFEASGMLSKYDNSYIKGLPEWFRNQLISFLKSLQDPETGYFYHPQWTKEEVNANLSRRSRDMTKSCSLLASLGSAPTYDTPTGVEGDGIRWDGTNVNDPVAPTSAMTTKLSLSNKVIAVSKVIPTASASVAPHLENDKTFKAYLAELAALNAAGKRSFYSIGNEIGSQGSEIKNREAVLKASGANYSLGDILIEWYSEHQNKETGLWDEGVNYDATNALLKIVGTYDLFGYIFPNADLALQSCLTMAVSDDEAETVCYVYNIWFAIGDLIASVEKYSKSAAEKEYANSVKATLLKMAPEAIRISAEKQLEFKKADGSFSFDKSGNCLTSQGLRVGIPGDTDGDVNATGICLGGTINRCLATMGLDKYAPGYFTEADRLKYIAILEELGPVIKDDVDVPVDYDDFDDDSIGSPPANITCENIKGGQLTVVNDPMPTDSSDKALKFVNNAGDYETPQINSQSGALSATCFVFETDMYIENCSEGKTFTQVLLQDGVYMINFVEENGKIQLLESSSTSWDTAKQQDLLVRLDLKKWFNLKIQYFVGDHDTVRIKVFIDGELIAVTDNYFDNTGKKLTGVGTPKDRMDFVNIIGITNTEMTMYLDNVACYKTTELYKPVPSNQKQPPINIDPPERDLIVYDFEENKIPDDFTVSANGATVSNDVVNGDGVLKIGATSTGATPSYISLPINVRFGRARCAVLDTFVTVSEDATGTLQRIWISDTISKTAPLACFDIVVNTIDGEKHVVLVEAPSGKPGLAVDGVSLPLGEEFHLRMEYYEQEVLTLIYINEKLVGLSNAACPNAIKSSAGALVMEGVAGATGNIIFDDFIFEKDLITFDGATSGDADQVVNGFDTLPEGATLSGGAVISDSQVKLETVGANAKLPLVEMNEVNTAVKISTEVIYKSGAGSYVFTLLSEDEREIIAFEMVIDKDSVEFYEYYAGGRGVMIGSASHRDYVIKLHINYYYKEATCNILIGSTPIAKTSLSWLHEREELIPSYLRIAQESSNVKIAIDNTVLEKTLELYKEITSEAALTKPSAKADENFEDLSLGNFPSNITSTLAQGASVAVKGMINGTITSKVLAFTTVSGSNDTLIFDMVDSAKLDDAKATVFEADFMFDADKVDKKRGVELYFRSGNSNATKFAMYSEPGTTINVSDYLSTKDKYSYSTNWTVSNGEFFKLRIEYISDGTNMKMNFFINGQYAGMSTIFVPNNKPYSADEITRMVFYTNGALVGTMYFDNVKFYQTKETTYVPSRDPGENFIQGGLTFEGFTSPWKDLDCGGTSTELPAEDKIIIRNTSTTSGGLSQSVAYINFFTDTLGSGIVFGKPNDAKHGELYLKNLGGTGNCYVFDTQMQLGTVDGLKEHDDKWILKLGFTNSYRTSNGGAIPTLFAPFNVVANDDGTFTIGSKNVSGEDWINLTLEYYPASNAFIAYVDGEVVSVRSVEGELQDFSRVALFLRKEASTAAIKFDNISAYVKDKTFSEYIPAGDSLKPEIPVIDTESGSNSGNTDNAGDGENTPSGGEVKPPVSDDDENDPVNPDTPPTEGGTFENIGDIPEEPDNASKNDGFGWT